MYAQTQTQIKSNQINCSTERHKIPFANALPKKKYIKSTNKNSSNRLENNESITHTRAHLSGSRRTIFIFGSGAFIRGTAGLRGEG
jgi:activator of HSP90 ATPase